MSEFKREHRYYVFKLKNLLEDQKQRLYAIQMELGPWNDVPECVVVESDWPNYQDTWADIQAVSEGRYISRAELQSERDALIGKADALANAILTALRGSKIDDHGNRGDDGLLPFGFTITAINALREVEQLAMAVVADESAKAKSEIELSFLADELRAEKD